MSRAPALGTALFGVFALAYVAAPPSLAYQTWDSLEYAYSCEVRGPADLWGNHPLGQLLGCGAFTVLRRLGYHGRALPIFMLVNGLAGGAAVAALFAVLRAVVGIGLLQAVGWALTLGGAYGLWRYAGMAETYSVTVLLVIAAWGLTVWSFERPTPGRNLLAGAAFGFATLTHQFAGVVLLAGTIGLIPLFKGRGWRALVAAVGVFAGAAALTTLVGYGLLGVFVTGSSSPVGIIRWLVGHGHNPSYGRFLTADGAATALRFFARALLGTRGLWGLRVPPLLEVVPAVALALISVVVVRTLAHRPRTLALSCMLQWVVGGVFIVWWAPTATKFWLPILPAFVMSGALAVAGLQSYLRGHHPGWQSRWLLDAVPLFAGGLLVLSTGTVMLRERQPDVAFERALKEWVRHSSPDDVLIENGRLSPHLIFWEHRLGTVNLDSSLRVDAHEPDRFAKLRQVIEQAARQDHAVLFSPGLKPYHSDDWLAVFGVTRQQVLNFFDQYPREGPLFEYQESDAGEVRQVYRLVVGAK